MARRTETEVMVESLGGISGLLDAWGAEETLHLARLAETVMLAGFDPESDSGDALLGELMASYVAEDIEGDSRPVHLVWRLAEGMDLVPDWVPDAWSDA